MNTFNASIGDPPHNFIDKSLPREDIPRKLQQVGNFIILTYHRTFTFITSDNLNTDDIKFIFNRYDGKIHEDYKTIDVHDNVPIYIHFNNPLTNMNYFFNNRRGLGNFERNYNYLKSVDFTYFDASELTTMSMLFKNCINLESVNFGNFVAPKLEKAEEMFSECHSIVYLNFSSFSAPNLEDADEMFFNCFNLKLLDLSNLNFPNLKYDGDIFYMTNILGYVNLNNFYLNSVLVNNLQEAAKGNVIICQSSSIITGNYVNNFCCNYNIEENQCYSENYIIIHFNQNCNYNNGFYNEYRKKVKFLTTSRSFGNTRGGIEITAGTKMEISLENDIETLEHFFDSRYDENMRYVESIDFSNFNSSLLINCKNLFYGCTSLKSINLSKLNLSKVINMEGMFQECNSLLSVDLSNFYKSKVNDTSFMFSNCASLLLLDLSNFDMTNIKNYTSMFNNINPKLKYLNIYDINKPDIFSDSDMNKINDLFVCQENEIISNINSHNVCCSYNLELDKCEITNYIELYYNKNVTYKTGFKNAYRKSLSYIIYEGEMIYDIQEFNISAGTKVELQFYYPPTDLESFFDVNYDENMHYIEKIDFSNFDSSSITNSKNMFKIL